MASTISQPRRASSRRNRFWSGSSSAAFHVVVGGEEKATGAGGGVAEPDSGFGAHHVDNRLDQGAGREVLSGAGLDVLGVFGQQPLVGVALDVGVHRHPLFLVDEVRHQPPELGRVLDLVLRLAEDDAKRSGRLAEFDENVPVVNVKLVAVETSQRLPVEPLGDDRRPLNGGFSAHQPS